MMMMMRREYLREFLRHAGKIFKKQKKIKRALPHTPSSPQKYFLSLSLSLSSVAS
jgi:hypothetical protein